MSSDKIGHFLVFMLFGQGKKVLQGSQAPYFDIERRNALLTQRTRAAIDIEQGPVYLPAQHENPCSEVREPLGGSKRNLTIQEVKGLTAPLIEKLVKAYEPQKVILFGSYAYGTPHQDSDIDLLIIKDTTDRLIDRMTTVRRILTDPNRLVALEILVLTPQEIENSLNRGDQFLSEIVERGVILYAA